MPESLNSYFRKYYPNGFYEDTKDFTKKEITERKRQYVEYYKDIMQEKKDYADSSAETMEKIVFDFNGNGSEVIFFRLPKKHELIKMENELSGVYYDKCRKLAKKNEKNAYFDFSEKLDYENSLNDGVHWTAKGAKAISSEINSKLKTLQ
jgi:lysophospholipase L1-like esterase